MKAPAAAAVEVVAEAGVVEEAAEVVGEEAKGFATASKRGTVRMAIDVGFPMKAVVEVEVGAGRDLVRRGIMILGDLVDLVVW
jgi:hypothetical protein